MDMKLQLMAYEVPVINHAMYTITKLLFYIILYNTQHNNHSPVLLLFHPPEWYMIVYNHPLGCNTPISSIILWYQTRVMCETHCCVGIARLIHPPLIFNLQSDDT